MNELGRGSVCNCIREDKAELLLFAFVSVVKVMR